MSALPSIYAAHVHPLIDKATDALIARAGHVYNDDGEPDSRKKRDILQGNDYAHTGLMSMLRDICAVQGLDERGLSDFEMLEHSSRYRAGGMGNADLPSLVENIANKLAMTPLRPEELSWRRFTTQSSLKDFKQTSRVNLGSASDLSEISNGGPIQRGYISDFKEYLQARTFGAEWVIEFQTFLNDDVGALVGLPLELRRKANKQVQDLVFAVLTENPTMAETGNALFSIAHGNLQSAGGQPSVTTVEEGFATIATQRLPSPTGDDTNNPGDFLNIESRYLIVPRALQGRGEVLSQSMFDPDQPAGSQLANTLQGRLEIIADVRLDMFNPAGWFLICDPAQHATIEVGFLGGREEPFVQQAQDWSTRGLKYAVWHDFDVKPMSYRGMYYNDGAT